MHRFRLALSLAVTLTSTSWQLPARAAPARDGQREQAKDARAAPQDAPESYSHFFQLGLRTSILGGYRMVFRYDESPLCSEPDFSKSLDDQQKFCGHMGPPMVDIAASFAPLGAIEPFAFGRFGLASEKQTDTKPLVMAGLGVRIYTRANAALKVFVEPSIAMEFEEGRGSTDYAAIGPELEYKQDLLFRAAVGPHWDVAKNFGVYAQVFGMSVGVLRSINATMEFGAGAQVRLP